MTLLFRKKGGDELDGLEVKSKEESWVKAPIIEDTVLVNLGALMERWTNTHYKVLSFSFSFLV